jgi:acetyltransferase
MHLFFAPRSVVLIGVTRQTGPGAYNNLEVIQRYGYRGRIHVVHPKVPEILGTKTHARVADLPEVPDLAVISLGRERVLPVFEECVAKGIRRVVVISQGFADADERGKELQHQLVDMARLRGVRVVGPNTMGIVNPFTALSTAFVDIPFDPAPPPLALVVQSGVFQVGFESFTGRMGKAIDIGNGCDVDVVDVLNYLEDDPQSRLIVLHMEGVARGREFLEVAGRVARNKPVVVFKTGRSAAGARAALSHTGSMVGEDAVFDMACQRAGLVRVRSMVELHAACQALLHFQAMNGPRVGVVTATGACGIMAADACEDYGLELAPFPEAMRASLENPYISWHRLHNPVDIWPLGMVSGSFTNIFKSAAHGLLENDRVDALLAIAPALSSPLHGDLDMAATLREMLPGNTQGKPIALWLYADDALRKAGELAGEAHVACFGSIDAALMGLAAIHRYSRGRRRAAEETRQHAAADPEASGAAVAASGVLVGETALAFLRDHGIPVASGRLVASEDTAASCARELGYPVVLKIVSPQWLHKSDWGGVCLNLKDEEALRAAFRDLMTLFQRRTPQGELSGMQVQKQVRGTELLLGVTRDPQFGPVVVAGMGGIYTEVFRDVSRSIAPLTRGDAREMLRTLRIFPILEGVRGQQPVAMGVLEDMLVALGHLAAAQPGLREMDLNPVMASAEGCWVVDCRVVFA